MMGDGAHQPVRTHAAPAVGRGAPRFVMQASDEFAGRRLGLQWQWNHNPEDTRWSLADRPGWMRLSAAPARYLVNARNTLTQMLTGPRMVVTTRIDLSRMAEGQRAGLTMFGVRATWLGAVREGGVTRLAFSSQGIETLGPPLPRIATFRAEVGPDQRAHYAWSADGRTFTPFGEVLELAQFSWWRGSRPGLFTFTRAERAGGSIDVDWFRVSPGGEPNR